ncbi:hypothetical protein Srot_2709 [Segniliparus rotundus DSM 44985]|uniref:SseB protein N-terminal domain-containing protein n=1 Tax=Segniliparus rotundus (strain ATCC BAA-972 / CDC 1076 / CIP 108378 / DSM 44985 / JCM 13578) TaxID=640132 RepID=D6ZCV6_SEGRD|nr:SAV_915 family protein [Segniliparus rotundus]ADG99143.1 hypothetical protein Srot_2709 [Segniliparus rotundus DSM 44985]
MSDWDSDSKRWGHYEDEEETVERVVRADGRVLTAEEAEALLAHEQSPAVSAVVDPAAVPGMVVVPAFPLEADNGLRMFVELWEQPDDVTLAVGFSSQQKLVEQLGPNQPWALLSTKQFQGLLSHGEVTALLLDPEPGVVSTRWSKAALAALAAMNEGR